MPDLQSWLLETETADAAYTTLALMNGEKDPRRWRNLFAYCRDPLPNALLLACSESVDPGPEGSDEEGVARQLTEIGDRLLSNGREDLALKTAARISAFNDALRPRLANAGDVHAQKCLLAELTARIDGGKPLAVNELFWAKAIRAPVLLPLLFGLLERTYATSEVPPPRVIVGVDRHDIVNPTIEAIASVGGRAAVACYDERIARIPDMRWLSPQRERVALEVLTRDGQRFLDVAAARAQVPCLTGGTAES
jgi:hypothetical protein